MLNKALLIGAATLLSATSFAQSSCNLSRQQPTCRLSAGDFQNSMRITVKAPGRQSGVCGFSITAPSARGNIARFAQNAKFNASSALRGRVQGNSIVYRHVGGDAFQSSVQISSNWGTLNNILRRTLGTTSLNVRAFGCGR